MNENAKVKELTKMLGKVIKFHNIFGTRPGAV